MAARKRPSDDAPPPREERPTVPERVAIIRRRILAKAWGPGDTAELAAMWDVSEVTVRALAGEAARQIEAFADVTQERAAIDGLLLEATDRARREPKDADAARALVAVAEERRKLAGIGVHKDPKNDPKATTPEPPHPAAGRVPVGFKQKKDQPS